MIRRFFERIVSAILLRVMRGKWGVTPVIMPFIVNRFGGFGALRWLAKNIPPYERAIKDIGPIRANVIFAVASLLNGCSYCTYAHGRAFELYYFEKYNKLFPLDDHQLISLIPLTDDAVRSELLAALHDAGLNDEIEDFHRLYAIKLEGATPTDSQIDKILVHAIHMFDDLNFCAIDSQSALDDAHDRINKDAALKARYAEARLESGRRPMKIEDLVAVEEAVRAAMPEVSAEGETSPAPDTTTKDS